MERRPGGWPGGVLAAEQALNGHGEAHLRGLSHFAGVFDFGGLSIPPNENPRLNDR